MSQKGQLITFEGGEGAGKSTLITYIADKLVSLGHEVIQTREPGGCVLSEKIRTLLFENAPSKRTELLLMLAARAEHVHTKILPALEKGTIVLCDRFVHSTLAYQGAGREMGIEEIKPLCAFAAQGIEPDLALYLDIDPVAGLKRAHSRTETNRMESEEIAFHKRVHGAFSEMAKRGNLVQIDASLSIEEVKEIGWSIVEKALV